jgi:Zn-finger nucleic acid-binding protein
MRQRGYRDTAIEVSVDVDDELRRRLDRIAEYSGGVLDRAGALHEAAMRGLDALEREIDLAAARSVRFCPRCGDQPLFPRELNGVLLQSCGICGGTWLDNVSAAALLRAVPADVLELTRRVLHNAQVAPKFSEPVLCPVCRKPAARREFPAVRVKLDICARHGTWFDLGELVRIMKAAERVHELERVEASADLVRELAQMHDLVASVQRQR